MHRYNLYDKSAKKQSANDTSAKPTVRMPTVRMRKECECQMCECQHCDAISVLINWTKKSTSFKLESSHSPSGWQTLATRHKLVKKNWPDVSTMSKRALCQRTLTHSPTPDTLTAHADPNAYTEAVTYSEASQLNPGRQTRSGADPLTDLVTEKKRQTTSGELNSLSGTGMMSTKMKTISSGLSSLAKSRQAKGPLSTLETWK